MSRSLSPWRDWTWTSGKGYPTSSGHTVRAGPKGRCCLDPGRGRVRKVWFTATDNENKRSVGMTCEEENRFPLIRESGGVTYTANVIIRFALGPLSGLVPLVLNFVCFVFRVAIRLCVNFARGTIRLRYGRLGCRKGSSPARYWMFCFLRVWLMIVKVQREILFITLIHQSWNFCFDNNGWKFLREIMMPHTRISHITQTKQWGKCWGYPKERLSIYVIYFR